MAVALAVPLFAATVTGVLVYSFLLGLGFGRYISIDLALMTEVLPTRLAGAQSTAGRDLAVLGLATTLPQALSPSIAAGLVSLTGGVRLRHRVRRRRGRRRAADQGGPVTALDERPVVLGDALRRALVLRLPEGTVLTSPESREGYRHDEAEWAPSALPAAVVRPTTAEQVRDVVRLCLEHCAPVVARGAGTGLSGGANAVEGCVIVSLERMDAVVEVNTLERYAVVQPGVVNDDLRAAAAGHGLWYPPDPASSPWSTIGGNVATNAGGVCCVKYGVTRDYVLDLQVVTGTGELVRVGRRTAKGVAGYDLVGLLVGSEGTLGIVTEVTVRLRPARPAEQTVVGYVDSLVAAGEAVAAVAAAGVVPSALELRDEHCLAAVDAWKHTGQDVCVPVGAVPAMLARIEEIGRRHDVRVVNIAHAGDGNLHPLLVTPPGDDAARERAQRAFAEIITAALELGGTVTGEHGVGLLKRDGLAAELAPAVAEMHRTLRRALDPHGILNPGKVVPA